MADKIIIGALSAPLYTFEGGQIDHSTRPLQLIQSHALSGDELSIDQLLPRVFSDAYLTVRFLPAGGSGLITADGKQFWVRRGPFFLDKLPYATPVWYYTDGVLRGKFYSKKVVRSGQTAFDLLAMSPIGVLEGQNHVGNVYTGQPWATVAAEVIGGAVPFTVADEVASIPVFGWLPKATRRDNLHQLLFAFGVMADKDSGGDLRFRFPDTSTVKTVPDGRIFWGGTIDFETPATRVEITEHAFLKLPSDELVTLFDNTDGSGVADYTTVDFQQAPIHDLEASGSLTIHESSVNHAVLSGTGVLTGRRYTHTAKVITQEKATTGENKTVSVTVPTLVNVANSRNVARRMLSFYGSSKTISADLIVENERPGDLLSFNDPFGEPATAFLASLDVTSTSFIRAACRMIFNYTPAWGGNNYSNAVVLTGSGSWAFTGKCRAVLIGGGSGGSSGCDGETGTYDTYDPGPATKGGAPGIPGEGGRILSVEMDISGSISYSCGLGGAGGINSGTAPVPGEDGTDTVFGSFTTANGMRSQTGAVNLFTGEVLGLPGLAGLPGGDGASSENPGGSVVWNGVTYYPGIKGTDRTISGYGTGEGGYGGGAAAGSNGGDGFSGGSETVNNVIQGLTGGQGGNGADAITPADASAFGQGGDAGHGGGGGGQGGDSPSGRGYPGKSGNPGKGSNGGKGAPGCIIVYY